MQIQCLLANIKQTIRIDIATGDPVTPEALAYQYKTLYEGKSIQILAYNLETILAKKM
ncbi:MAG TPA: hypothetical protein DD636_02515 [Anaerolineaceae bacterium]|jgi:hypothetical protein|nr:hypothetical protein [Anaerolineaceae bacterium]